MKPFLTVFIGIFAAAAALAVILSPKQTTPLESKANSLYDFKMKDINGKDKNLADFKGKVVLIVNTASKCGNTPQYKGLQELYDKHKEEGLVILGFPANEFAGQEPGSNADIKEFCTKNYGVTFPMFSKIVVKGKDTHPLYQWLVNATENKNDVEWNFAKFLVNREGQVIARFDPKTTPESPKLNEALNKALSN